MQDAWHRESLVLKGINTYYDRTQLSNFGEYNCQTSEEPVENPQTGINYGYIILPIGIIFIIAILKIAKKNTKIYKI